MLYCPGVPRVFHPFNLHGTTETSGHHPAQAPAQGRVRSSRLLRAGSPWSLNVSKDGASATETRGTFSLCLDGASCVSIWACCCRCWHWHHWEEPGSVVSIPPSGLSAHGRDPPEHRLPQAGQPQLSQPPRLRQMLPSLHHLRGPLLASPRSVHVSLALGSPGPVCAGEQSRQDLGPLARCKQPARTLAIYSEEA